MKPFSVFIVGVTILMSPISSAMANDGTADHGIKIAPCYGEPLKTSRLFMKNVNAALKENSHFTKKSLDLAYGIHCFGDTRSEEKMLFLAVHSTNAEIYETLASRYDLFQRKFPAFRKHRALLEERRISVEARSRASLSLEALLEKKRQIVQIFTENPTWNRETLDMFHIWISPSEDPPKLEGDQISIPSSADREEMALLLGVKRRMNSFGDFVVWKTWDLDRGYDEFVTQIEVLQKVVKENPQFNRKSLGSLIVLIAPNWESSYGKIKIKYGATYQEIHKFLTKRVEEVSLEG